MAPGDHLRHRRGMPPAPTHELTDDAVSTRALASFLGLGVAFDVALNGQRPGLSIPLFVMLLVAVVARWIRHDHEDDLLLGAALLLSIFPALRASEGLIAADVLAAGALLALAAAKDERGAFRTTVESLFRRAGHVLLALLRVPAAVLAPAAGIAGRLPLGRWRGVVRGLAIAAPVVAVFAALLASADAVFGELLIPSLPSLDLGGAVGHVGLTMAGVAGVATLWLASRKPVTPGFPDQTSLLPRLHAADAGAVLVGIDVLFLLFVGVQFAVLFGGHERVEVTPGLTYAEYARSGFFQLIAVAGLAVAVILAAWDMGDRREQRHQRWFRGLVTLMVALTGVILASALMRLALYEQTFGFTVNRLAGYLTIGFIGFVLLALVVAIWAGARERVVASLLVGVLLTLIAANVINPERFVAERNASRYERTGAIDVAYLGFALGADAVPVMADLLPRLDEPDASTLRAALCEQLRRLEHEPGWRSANLGRSGARDALARAGIGPASCGEPVLG